jgi:hypothetical protein
VDLHFGEMLQDHFFEELHVEGLEQKRIRGNIVNFLRSSLAADYHHLDVGCVRVRLDAAGQLIAMHSGHHYIA